MGASLVKERCHSFTRRDDTVFQFTELGRHLAQELHDATRPRGSRQRSVLALILGKPRKPFRGALNVRQQALCRQRVLMRLVEVGRIVLNRLGQMLLERRRSGKSRRVEPARHGNNHRAAERHHADQGAAERSSGDVGIEARHVGPEGVDGDRDRSGIDDCREEDRSRRAIEKTADAEIGVNARPQSQDSKRKARHCFDSQDAVLQAMRCGKRHEDLRKT